MTTSEITAKALELHRAGMDAAEIRRVLFNIKGSRLAQINRAMEAVGAESAA